MDGKNLPDWLRKAIEEHFNPIDPSLVTCSVPEAGRFLGLGRSANYEAQDEIIRKLKSNTNGLDLNNWLEYHRVRYGW